MVSSRNRTQSFFTFFEKKRNKKQKQLCVRLVFILKLNRALYNAFSARLRDVLNVWEVKHIRLLASRGI